MKSLLLSLTVLCYGLSGESSFASFQQCELGGSICPRSNTCCLSEDDGSSGCIPSDLGASNATCCPDKQTGCGAGYDCAGDGLFCRAHSSVQDPLVQRMPRYRLCHITNASLLHLWGFPVRHDYHRLAYYSSHGDLQHSQNSQVRRAIVVVHGAARNADDYFCSMLELAKTYSAGDIWVVAPYFVGITDPESHSYLSWNESDGLGGDNPWRYGADALQLGVTLQSTPISSFEAMDALVHFLLQTMEHVTVVGHSAGGQFVQRWGLLSTVDEDKDDSLFQQIRVVVANPSSFAYLSPERYDPIQEQWIIPRASDCPDYNRWEWGLDVKPRNSSDSASLASEYVISALQKVKGIDQLLQRIAQRDMIYLAGGQDRCNVSQYNTDGWCYSHGLETTCMDIWQGTNRLERHVRYLESIRRARIHRHRHWIVPDVGHDHSLMFHSTEGRLAILALDGMEETMRHEDTQS